MWINAAGFLAYRENLRLSAEQVGRLMDEIMRRAQAGDTSVFLESDFIAQVDPNDLYSR